MPNLVFVTPSYRGDIDRFALLRRTITKFYKGDAQHIVLVPTAFIIHPGSIR
jgi:hypothetical protein